MTTGFARSLARLTIITVLAASLGACSTVTDTLASLDPFDDTPAVDESAAGSPDLASIPSAPPTTDDQSAAATTLAASGAQAQYSADALRAGTEASASPPAAATPASQLALAAPPTADAPPTAAAPAPPAAAPTPAAALPAGAAPPIAVASAPAAAAPIPVSAAPASAAAPVQTASLSSPAAETPAGAEPAVPAVPPAGAIRSTAMTPAVMSDAALGFKPSAAPPLDPSVSNFVPQPILARYSRTAAQAGASGSANAAVPVSGSTVVASAGGLAGLGGAQPTSVILFPGDGASLTAAARAQIRTAVAAFKAAGGTGSIRVVGHASSRTADMPVEKHLELIFEKSHKRALAVLQELVRQGVPADHVQVEAVGDSQPVYYESMPKGEEGNRRAEIFVQ